MNWTFALDRPIRPMKISTPSSSIRSVYFNSPIVDPIRSSQKRTKEGAYFSIFLLLLFICNPVEDLARGLG